MTRLWECQRSPGSADKVGDRFDSPWEASSAVVDGGSRSGLETGGGELRCVGLVARFGEEEGEGWLDALIIEGEAVGVQRCVDDRRGVAAGIWR